MTATVLNSDEKDLRKIVFQHNEVTRGRSNATGSVTLTVSSTTTDVTAQNCAAGSQVFLSPMTANAAAAVASTYISAVANGSFTITHANNSQTDRDFGYVCLG